MKGTKVKVPAVIDKSGKEHDCLYTRVDKIKLIDKDPTEVCSANQLKDVYHMHDTLTIDLIVIDKFYGRNVQYECISMPQIELVGLWYHICPMCMRLEKLGGFRVYCTQSSSWTSFWAGTGSGMLSWSKSAVLSLLEVESKILVRIAELREHECEIAVEDVMYMLVLHKFSEIRVHLVPRLSRCIYNGRLEIWPSKDWELESIHNFEVLEMIREHLTAVIGWRADSNVTDNWATTQIPRLQLCGVYAASILYGYFLKSISLRHHLELSVAEANCDLGITCRNPLPQSELWSCGIKNIAFGRISNTQSISVGQDSCSRGKKREKLRRYIMGFDPETLQMRAKPKTKEVVNLVEKHSCALFGDEKTGLIETNEVILTSLSSLKRIVLEAVAFGSFLWDTEEYVDAVYKLKEN
ncbi:hypothetical protein TEA_005362 [Camellia sinensis var. sinensis]|uniref:Uncharacterized protein n=1 Tax=Camellia sinensis var. sinensis TaxID=542762 RepID=A0A4V3WPU8_CAMSN|nr:hypothetical protein TEA_005362 [Camellia sinensis var. sinensis]